MSIKKPFQPPTHGRVVARTVDLETLGCDWPGSIHGTGIWRTRCRFKAKHLISGVAFCNTHFRLVRRYVEKHANAV